MVKTRCHKCPRHCLLQISPCDSRLRGHLYSSACVERVRSFWPRSRGSVLTAPPVVQRAAMCTEHWVENEDRT
ncbi:hypothetical protein AMELA_G00103810 [Ameiurus melas]|uniref:Uncharacterized protein n=1 Tax=Ameiurus melas TaxID=219545 RepID=A0A7J6ATL7_AMEME|nr:hypothetical protein AMELA_G00103810 [Ameiurus melas]